MMYVHDIFLNSVILYAVNITLLDHDITISNQCKDTLIHGMDALIMKTHVNFTNVGENVARALSFEIRYNSSKESKILCEIQIDPEQCGKHHNKGCFCHRVYSDGTMDIVFITPAFKSYRNARIFAQATSLNQNEIFKSTELVIPPIYELTGDLQINNKTYPEIKSPIVIRIPADIKYCCSESNLACVAAVNSDNEKLSYGKRCAQLNYSKENILELSLSVSACGHTKETNIIIFVSQSDIPKKSESDNIFTTERIICIMQILIIVLGVVATVKLYRKISSLELQIQKLKDIKPVCQCEQQKSSSNQKEDVTVENALNESISSKAQENDISERSKIVRRLRENKTQDANQQEIHYSELTQNETESEDENSSGNNTFGASNVLTLRV